MLKWMSDEEVVKRLKVLDALSKEKDCLRLLLEIFDEETSEKIISGG